MLPDVCIVTFAYDADSIRIAVLVVAGEARTRLFAAARSHLGVSTSAILDMVTRTRLRRCATNAPGTPTLRYTWLALQMCPERVRAACGIRRGMPCDSCGARSGKAWGLNADGDPQCLACFTIDDVRQH
jgi:hypothetical protein